MKVALVANRFPSLSETFIYNHAAGLRASGIDVTVIATTSDNDAKLFSDFDGVQYDGPIEHQVLQRDPLATMRELAIRMSRDQRHVFSVWREATKRYGRSRRALRAALLALPLDAFDIVHLEYSGLAVAWCDALALRTRAKVVVSCRGAAEQITPLVHPERVAVLADVFSRCDRVHCVSLDMQRTCEGYGLDPAKAFVNRPAIDVRRFRRTAPYIARDDGPCRLLSTGRLHWKKGLEYALLAVRLLVDAGRSVLYEIIGAGREEERLRFAVNDLRLGKHVHFAGRRTSTEVRAALERTDIFLLPSLSEGISNAALEAMAMEIPLVTTSAGGMNEAVADGTEGIVVPPRDPRSIADAIATLLDDRVLRTKIGRNARTRIERDFSLERQIDVYLREYHSVLNGART